MKGSPILVMIEHYSHGNGTINTTCYLFVNVFSLCLMSCSSQLLFMCSLQMQRCCEIHHHHFASFSMIYNMHMFKQNLKFRISCPSGIFSNFEKTVELWRKITFCGNYSTGDDKLFILQQLHRYYNYNCTNKNHNTQAPTELGKIPYGSYCCSSTQNELIKLNGSFGEYVYGINMMLPVDIIDVILQYYKLIIMDSILQDHTLYNEQNDDKTHGKSV